MGAGLEWKNPWLIVVCFASLVAPPVAAANPGQNYYFDAGWRTSAGVNAALGRIEAIVEADPEARVEVLVHGNDIRLFARGKTNQRPQIVARSKRLAADGRVVFKVCEHALEYKNLELDDLPQHFGTVHYVPEHINALQVRGFRPVALSRAASEP